MEMVTIVLYGGAMFALGMYTTTQISSWIDSRVTDEKVQDEEPYNVPASDWDDEEED